MTRSQRSTVNRGMTLVEILMVSLLLVVIVVAFLGLFGVSFALNEHSRNVVIALNDAASVIEDMRQVDPFTVATIVAFYPDGSAVSGGYDNLPSESVVVDYSSIGSEAVTVNVTVSWSERNRDYQETVTTVLTRR